MFMSQFDKNTSTTVHRNDGGSCIQNPPEIYWIKLKVLMTSATRKGFSAERVIIYMN
jgi:hypothetical protein